MLVTPSRSGDNAIHLTFVDRVGSPRGIDVAPATVTQGDLPPRPIQLEPLAGSHLGGTGSEPAVVRHVNSRRRDAGRAEQSAFNVEIDVAEQPGG